MNLRQWLYFFGLVVLLGLAAIGPSQGTEGIVQPSTASDPGSTPAASISPALRTFTSGGHVLGFGPEGYYVAGLDHALRVRFVGARAVEPQAPNAPEGVTGKASPLQQVRYPGLWPGVDLEYSSAGGLVQSLYRLAPGATVASIQLDYNRPLQILNDGRLQLGFEHGTLTETAPIAWQDIGGGRRPVEVAFDLRGEQRLGFRLGTHDPTQPLIIDPSLSWNTFLGWSDVENSSPVHSVGISLTLSIDGSAIFVAGNFNPYMSIAGTPTADLIAVAKFDTSTGKRLWFTTFVNSKYNGDYARDIAVDHNGDVYVVGYTFYFGYADVFSIKFDGQNGAIIWAKGWPSDGYDEALSVAVDGKGDVYFTGWNSAEWGSPVRPFSAGIGCGAATNPCSDAFVIKFRGFDGERLWHTFLGSPTHESGWGITTDSDGNVYVTGSSFANWGDPVRAFTYGVQCDSEHCYTIPDVMVAKLNGSTGQLIWNTFLGGTGDDFARGIAVNNNGILYVGGNSNSPWGGAIHEFNGLSDIFVAMLDTSTGQLIRNTFLGSAQWDYCNDLTLDGAGNPLITGYSEVSWGNPIRPAPDLSCGESCKDIMVAKLSGVSGQLLWHGFLGSPNVDSGFGIVADKQGGIYITGFSDTSWGSPVDEHSVAVCGGEPCQDVMVAKLTDKSPGSLTLGQALDNPSLQWTSSRGAPWFGQTAVSYWEGDAAQSGAIGDELTSTLRTSVQGPGWLRFHWKVSSERGYDFLRFYLDGQLQLGISGEQDWRQQAFRLSPGTHNLLWSYEKDVNLKAGSDAGWVDLIELEQWSGVTLAVELNNSGWLKSWPAGIDCRRQGDFLEGACQANFPPGTQVSLSAVNDGHQISAWGGACRGNAPVCSLSLISNTGVNVSFVSRAALNVLPAIGDTGAHPSLTLTTIGQGQVNASLTNGTLQLSGCRTDTAPGNCYKAWPGALPVILSAIPDGGQDFEQWEGDGCAGNVPQCTLLIDGARGITARFKTREPASYALQVQKTGQGSVSGSGLNCGSQCSGNFAKDATVSLSATAASGYTFNGWSGTECSGSGGCTLSMDGPKEVTASFVPSGGGTTLLSITKPEHGLVHTPGGDLWCGTQGNACAKNYPTGSEVLLLTQADSGYLFNNWGGACSGKSDCRVLLDSPKTVEASFVAIPQVSYQLIVTAGVGGSLNVSGQSPCSAGQSCTYPELSASTQVSLTAVPASGYRFNGWEGDCASQGTPCTLAMSQNRNTTASFTTATPPKLSVYTSGQGTVTGKNLNCSGTCQATYSLNETISLTATPGGGTRFGGWGGACAGQGNPCSLQMKWDRSLTAQFINDNANAAVLSLDVSGAGTVTSDENPPKLNCRTTGCAASYGLGQIAKLSATPDPGASFLGWGGACSGQGNPCSLSMNAAKSVTASFSQAGPPLTQINLSGKVLLSGTSIPVCAMVLANGQSQFSCDGQGNFNLASVPLDQNRQVTLYTWAEGFNPYKLVFTPVTSSEQRNVAMTVSPCGGVNGPGGSGPGTVTQLDISGQVLLNGTTIPVCAMVLANGQSQFSCDGAGNFLLSDVPVDQSGKVTLYSWAEGFLPYKDVFTPSGTSVSRTVLMRTNCAATETGG